MLKQRSPISSLSPSNKTVFKTFQSPSIAMVWYINHTCMHRNPTKTRKTENWNNPYAIPIPFFLDLRIHASAGCLLFLWILTHHSWNWQVWKGLRWERYTCKLRLPLFRAGSAKYGFYFYFLWISPGLNPLSLLRRVEALNYVVNYILLN